MEDKNNRVDREYTAAITGESRGLVAGTGNARFADYGSSSTEAPPADLLETSFGCGDPVSLAQIQPGHTVLDLGCGAGLDLILGARKAGPNGSVIGVDANEAMLERARGNVRAARLDTIELRRGTLESLPVQSGSVDIVISNCVINLVGDKASVFSEIARVLKPGGRMIVSDIVAENLPLWARKGAALGVACVGGAIAESEYLDGLSAAGLQGAKVLARQHYEASQMAAVAVDALPAWVQRIRCCGTGFAQSFLTRVARPLETQLWSVRIAANRQA